MATPDTVRIELQPLGRTLSVPRGVSLRDTLFAQGVEFPCGGRARCRGCRIRVLDGAPPSVPEEDRVLDPGERADGWRLACRLRAVGDLRLELGQWEMGILGDEGAFAFTPQEGWGVAVDLGTTTVVAQLVDRQRGTVRAVRSALNAQAAFGADLITRITSAARDGSRLALTGVIRRQVADLIGELLAAAGVPAADLKDVILVGNTLMHHLFCGLPIEPLARHPFESDLDGLQTLTLAALDDGFPEGCPVRFLPCLGGLVGSDLLAGILATGLHASDALVALVDLGTNGEIVLGNREGLLCASTAAGPAFEGARISMGMRAVTGAIAQVELVDGQPRCHVIGGGPPRGICGSGLVDAAAAGLATGDILPAGRLARGNPLALAAPVTLTQADIRELQLAKGAIAAGLRLLAHARGARVEDLACLHLAGAFGNYIDRTSARRIGLLTTSEERIQPAGNTALRGAKIALGLPDEPGDFAALRRRVRHVALAGLDQFEDAFVEALRFPEGTEAQTAPAQPAPSLPAHRPLREAAGSAMERNA